MTGRRPKLPPARSRPWSDGATCPCAVRGGRCSSRHVPAGANATSVKDAGHPQESAAGLNPATARRTRHEPFRYYGYPPSLIFIRVRIGLSRQDRVRIGLPNHDSPGADARLRRAGRRPRTVEQGVVPLSSTFPAEAWRIRALEARLFHHRRARSSSTFAPFLLASGPCSKMHCCPIPTVASQKGP